MINIQAIDSSTCVHVEDASKEEGGMGKEDEEELLSRVIYVVQFNKNCSFL